MGERVISGDFCKLGVRVITTKIIKGEWPLEELFQSNRCYCNCGKPHDWMCLVRFHQHGYRFSVQDMATFVKANFTKIKKRPNLVKELKRIQNGSTSSHMWVYVMYPIIKDMKEFQDHISKTARNPGSHAYAKALATIGVARKAPEIDRQNYSNDILLYFSLMDPKNQPMKNSISFGRYSNQFLKIICEICNNHGLPEELILHIFNLTYRTAIKHSDFIKSLTFYTHASARLEAEVNQKT